MRVLALGRSSILVRRVLPALRGLEVVQRVDVATRQAAGAARVPWTDGDVYADYAEALDRAGPDLVYVSLANSEHQRWAQAALDRGHHVVVDKPAFLSLAGAEAMLALAERRGVCLAEATVYEFHPQVEVLREQFRAMATDPCRVSATFAFPPMDPANFRYRRDLGGGALWDLGPYAVSLGRVFFHADPEALACHVLARGGPDDVEIAFALLARYPGGRCVVGTFGFDTVYRNRLELLAEHVGVELDRAFTTPPEVANEVRVTRRDGTTIVVAPAGDAFGAFFAHVIRCVSRGDWGTLAEALHRDAQTLHRLRVAAGVE